LRSGSQKRFHLKPQNNFNKMRAFAFVLLAGSAAASPSFVVANNKFLLDGAPFSIKSGSIHYHRTHYAQWRDRLERIAAMGLNAIQLYVPWNTHLIDGVEGAYDWGQVDPQRNLSAFLDTAASVGLYVHMRPGPFVCGEHEMGGLPWSAYNRAGLVFRTNNTAYLSMVEGYWRAVMRQLKPHLRAAGGPVLMVQMENEFGSYGACVRACARAPACDNRKGSRYCVALAGNRTNRLTP